MNVPTRHQAPARHVSSSLLGIYLNDHLAGATGGTERARHMTRSYGRTQLAATLEPIATEIAEDRATLLALMDRLDIPARSYKVYASRVAERLGRLKSNGRLVRRSPLSPLLELEALRVGVEGKTALWQTLRDLADHEKRLDPDLLDHLVARARRQQDVLEKLRRRQLGTALLTK
ncbi:hypothetical protein [Streptomyces sp. NPDC005017]|uniref:hypothetical protein n=1 Tax=Streptomyces sp. NPDC005017 TaxID=3364706 RepID=UPI0036D1619B